MNLKTFHVSKGVSITGTNEANDTKTHAFSSRAESHLSLSLPRSSSSLPGVSLVTLSQRTAPTIDPPTGDD